mmetsp:Transcript_28048/g.94224  ORF Transcript_28048/g.94224 Transcript_28048/m.94224 type:complete len:342 (-) Transcript_28048:995-2020(-)
MRAMGGRGGQRDTRTHPSVTLAAARRRRRRWRVPDGRVVRLGGGGGGADSVRRAPPPLSVVGAAARRPRGLLLLRPAHLLLHRARLAAERDGARVCEQHHPRGRRRSRHGTYSRSGPRRFDPRGRRLSRNVPAVEHRRPRRVAAGRLHRGRLPRVGQPRGRRVGLPQLRAARRSRLGWRQLRLPLRRGLRWLVVRARDVQRRGDTFGGGGRGACDSGGEVRRLLEVRVAADGRRRTLRRAQPLKHPSRARIRRGPRLRGRRHPRLLLRPCLRDIRRFPLLNLRLFPRRHPRRPDACIRCLHQRRRLERQRLRAGVVGPAGRLRDGRGLLWPRELQRRRVPL